MVVLIGGFPEPLKDWVGGTGTFEVAISLSRREKVATPNV